MSVNNEIPIKPVGRFFMTAQTAKSLARVITEFMAELGDVESEEEPTVKATEH